MIIGSFSPNTVAIFLESGVVHEWLYFELKIAPFRVKNVSKILTAIPAFVNLLFEPNFQATKNAAEIWPRGPHCIVEGTLEETNSSGFSPLGWTPSP
jgi:hypothetical protein